MRDHILVFGSPFNTVSCRYRLLEALVSETS